MTPGDRVKKIAICVKDTKEEKMEKSGNQEGN